MMPDQNILGLALLVAVIAGILYVGLGRPATPDVVAEPVEETVPLEERCSRIHPTPCNRRAVMALGPYQWCEQDMPERLRDGQPDEVFDQEATA